MESLLRCQHLGGGSYDLAPEDYVLARRALQNVLSDLLVQAMRGTQGRQHNNKVQLPGETIRGQ